jgi:hypothetical protein
MIQAAPEVAARSIEMTPPKTNERLKAIAAEHLLRTKRIEDGELVIRLRGKKQGAWPSDHTHAGMWSSDTMYVLVPCNHPRGRAQAACQQFPHLVDRSSDGEVLLLGSIEDVLALLSSGPMWARARKKRQVSPEEAATSAERLKATQFARRSA